MNIDKRCLYRLGCCGLIVTLHLLEAKYFCRGNQTEARDGTKRFRCSKSGPITHASSPTNLTVSLLADKADAQCHRYSGCRNGHECDFDSAAFFVRQHGSFCLPNNLHRLQVERPGGESSAVSWPHSKRSLEVLYSALRGRSQQSAKNSLDCYLIGGHLDGLELRVSRT